MLLHLLKGISTSIINKQDSIITNNNLVQSSPQVYILYGAGRASSDSATCLRGSPQVPFVRSRYPLPSSVFQLDSYPPNGLHFSISGRTSQLPSLDQLVIWPHCSSPPLQSATWARSGTYTPSPLCSVGDDSIRQATGDSLSKNLSTMCCSMIDPLLFRRLLSPHSPRPFAALASLLRFCCSSTRHGSGLTGSSSSQRRYHYVLDRLRRLRLHCTELTKSIRRAYANTCCSSSFYLP